ncbi:MAG: type II toxin-antitoxin system RelE/ParE family toxin [Burkholderiales bacterium]|nr:type II toxin-antitoxin system RelE/ParE family toxin [Burkholderiales bacterium]
MKRVFKTRHFSRWMRKTELTDAALCEAVAEMSQGLIDADLGGGVVKKRLLANAVAPNWCYQRGTQLV